MRQITKLTPPGIFVTWRKSACGSDLHYNQMPGDVKHAVRERILAEQRFLCAYTGLQINSSSAHVEHLKPQKYCSDSESSDYLNMVACYPSGRSWEFGGGKLPYGAHEKNEFPDNESAGEFVSPLSPGCAARFIFNANGKVVPREGDSAAKRTIQELALDHGELTELRKRAINGVLGRRFDTAVPAAKRRLTKLQSSAEPSCEAFCFVLEQVLIKYISSKSGKK